MNRKDELKDKMKKDILIIAQYTQAPGETGNGRFHYLAQMLVNQYGSEVEIVTMDFSHHRKQKRHIQDTEIKRLGYKLTMVHVTEYGKNVSVRRLFSNYVMGINLSKYLEQRKKPDAVYVAVPSLDAGKAAVKYCLRNGIRCIIDIQDLWPEVFRLSLNVPVLSDVLFHPMEKMADYIYANADSIVSVSATYAKRALKVNKKGITPLVVFLGTELSAFDAIKPAMKDPEHLTIAYVGTLGASYDLTTVIDAIGELTGRGICDLKLLVMGDGPDKEKFEKHAQTVEIQCEFTGRLPYVDMVSRLKTCDIAVNPIHKNAPQSIINKHADYAAAALPVISTQQCEEYNNLIEEYQAGVYCPEGTASEIAKALENLIKDEGLRKRMSIGSRRMAEEQFDRKRSYRRIADEICR